MGRYDVDLHAWAHEQADAARRRSPNELDWDNIAEELESLGKQQESELRKRYVILLTHLLKWRFQPGLRSKSWRLTIKEQRLRLEDYIAENPSLQPLEVDAFTRAYGTARLRAARGTNLDEDVFPLTPPFTREQAKSDSFWPEVE